jgi:hypothetical protein
MYHEEKEINGLLHHRGTPDGLFIPYSAEELTFKYLVVCAELNTAKAKIALRDDAIEKFLLEVGRSGE